MLCRPCRVVPPDFEKAVAHGVYTGKLRTLLHLLKYDGMAPLAKRLGALLAEQVVAIPDLPNDLVAVPVPLFGKKLRSRGFNQSELLARGLLGALRQRRPDLRIKLASALLVRRRATESQAGLDPHERRANVRGAFFVPRPEVVRGRNVILIDDIYTTGATARACSAALRKAGAASIRVATVARAQIEFAPQPEDLHLREPERAELPMEEDFTFWEEGRTHPVTPT
jgi:ComF family protein